MTIWEFSRRRLTRFIVLVACALAWNSTCSSPEPAPPANPNDRSITINSHGLHLVRNKRLREIMHRLKELDFDAVAIELEATGGLRRDVCEISDLAAALAGDAQVIPLIFEDPDMSDESRRVMNRLSAQLRWQAIELGEAADENHLDQVKTRLNAMLNTCNDCHASFRAPSLALGFRLVRPTAASQATIVARQLQ